MDIVPLIHALILGIVEGLTEFLPVSSTGHLIVVGDLIHFNDEKGKVFEIVIQFGAILAVVWEYRAKILRVLVGLRSDRTSQRFALNLLAAFMPAAVLGLLFGKAIKAHLFQPIPVATAFIVGAFIILWAEKRKHRVRIDSIDELRIGDAFKIGLAQSLALIPGTSRSGATIIGGLLIGMSRTAATEFSFFLAIPTLTAATGYEIVKNRALFSSDDIGIFSVGFVTSFVAAFLCVRWLLRYVGRHDFTPFAWYRIAFGMLILATWHWGVVDWSNP